MSRKPLPLDIRPKWDDPSIGISSNDQDLCSYMLNIYDSLPRDIRDKIKEQDFFLARDSFGRLCVVVGVSE